MIRKATTFLCSLLLSISIMIIPNEAGAMPRTGRAIDGVIQNIDFQNRKAEILHQGELKMITWTKNAKVYRNGTEIAAESMRNGDYVKAWRHVPLFGPPFVRRLNLTSNISK